MASCGLRLGFLPSNRKWTRCDECLLPAFILRQFLEHVTCAGSQALALGRLARSVDGVVLQSLLKRRSSSGGPHLDGSRSSLGVLGGAKRSRCLVRLPVQTSQRALLLLPLMTAKSHCGKILSSLEALRRFRLHLWFAVEIGVNLLDSTFRQSLPDLVSFPRLCERRDGAHFV